MTVRTRAALVVRGTVIAIGRGIVAIAWLALAAPGLAASPSPSAGIGGDPRSSGQGPGLVGDPLVALLAVLAIGIGALLVTLAYIRFTGRRSV